MELNRFLTECLFVSEKAYTQEIERQKAIGTKLEYLFKWLTIFVAIGNIGVPLIAKYISKDLFTGVFWCLYIVIAGCLVTSLILIVVVQFPQKQKYFPLGTDIIKKLKKSGEEFETEEEWYYQQILYWDNMTKKLEKNNNNTIRVIRVIDSLFILAIILLAILFMYILRGAI